MKVFITIDTEIWCGSWRNLDDAFPSSFNQYIYGPTAAGDFGLPFLIKVLNDHGLTGVFFVETLFALRFGLNPLQEIVGLILEAGHSVELHAHTEWLDEARQPVLGRHFAKRQYIHQFTADEQFFILQLAADLLRSAGAKSIAAFRAGSFGADNTSIDALRRTGIQIDSSYNPTAPGCLIKSNGHGTQAWTQSEIVELPVSTFMDGIGRTRPAQLTACSWPELRHALTAALDLGWETFVILTHNFELLSQNKTRRNPITVRRFRNLCEHLEKHRDCLHTTNFATEIPTSFDVPPKPIAVPTHKTLRRHLEQIVSNLL